MVEDAISFWTDIQRFEDMLAADPRSHCFVPLSELYRKLGLLEDAISVAQKGCSMHPDYPAGFLALGTALNEKGQKDEAIRALERATHLQPDGLKGLHLLGQLYVEEGYLEQARKVLGQLLRQYPEDTESALLLRSISAGSAEPGRPEEEVSEEEVLEDLEVIEELEPFEEEEPAPAAAAGSQSVGEAFAQPQPAALAAARVATAEPFSSLEEEEDFWAIEEVEEPEPASYLGKPAAAAAPGALEAGTSQPANLRDPLSTATLAELYLSQGFIDKALAIYRQLLGADPGNLSYLARCEELERVKAQQAAPPAVAPQAPLEPGPEPAPLVEEQASPAAAPPLSGGAEAVLESWLENIRRRRDGV